MILIKKDYNFWKSSLSGNSEQVIYENAPQCGFYKRRTTKNGPWIPVAFWRDEKTKEILCAFQGKISDPTENWIFSCKNPVSEEMYRYAIKHGYWSDEFVPPSIGHNMPSDPFEILKLEIESCVEQVQSFIKSTPREPTKHDADRARNMNVILNALIKRADVMHKTEKAPHLAASREIDEKFLFRKNVTQWANKLISIYEYFMKAEDARLRTEARKKYETDKNAAESNRAQFERDDPILAFITPREEIKNIQLTTNSIKVQVGGGIGRKAGLKTIYEPIIEDYDAALHHFSNHHEVRSLIEKLVRADIRLNKNTCSVPGVRVFEQKKAV